MEKMRINNLRSLKDTGEINIKKMNILVGNNSSGKSTFLRIFPLLKQTFNNKVNGPILWCGDDDDYVDFGSFNEAVNYSATEKCINLEFEFKIDIHNDRFSFGVQKKQNKKENVKVLFSIKSGKSGREYIALYKYKLRQYTLEVYFSEQNQIVDLYLDGEKIELDTSTERYFSYFYYSQSVFDVSLDSIGRSAYEHLSNLLNILDSEKNLPGTFERRIEQIYNNKILNEKTGKDIKLEKICDKKNVEKVLQWVVLYNFAAQYRSISNYLRTYFLSIYYIAPIRATAERYYRLRNIAVKEVDCRGKNLPIFLNSLSEQSFKQFQNFTKTNLGFEVEKKSNGGHVSLEIKKNGQQKAINLSDTGFGYSQILPIVTQVWYIQEEAKRRKDMRDMPFDDGECDIPLTVVIEQPELHLHPGLQAKLIDVMINVIQEGNINFIIETHSDTMINRIGDLISKKKVKKDDVNIIIFEKKNSDDNTVVTQGGYDEEGYLLPGWPVGFFEPEED